MTDDRLAKIKALAMQLKALSIEEEVDLAMKPASFANTEEEEIAYFNLDLLDTAISKLIAI